MNEVERFKEENSRLKNLLGMDAYTDNLEILNKSLCACLGLVIEGGDDPLALDRLHITARQLIKESSGYNWRIEWE